MIAFADEPGRLSPHIRRSLEARIERLLRRPVVADMPAPDPEPAGPTGAAPSDSCTSIFDAFSRLAAAHAPQPGDRCDTKVWRPVDNDEDGGDGVRVRIGFDYDGADRGREKEIVEALMSVVRDEGEVVLLTGEQARMLRESPRAFVESEARPEAVQLLGFTKDWHGSAERVVELELARGPLNPASIAAIAIMPNLVQLERQLDALDAVERAAVDGPLAPLRALLGLEADLPDALHSRPAELDLLPGELLDEHQRSCVSAALATDHFAVVHGPPGAGKTTVIGSIIRRLVDRGERVLVVSPTHVAIDNVVEKLTDIKPGTDDLHPATMPVRFASRPARLSMNARRYWAGKTKQARSETIAQRVESVLRARVEGADRWFDKASGEEPGVSDGRHADPCLSARLAERQSVICGTPIGLLTHEGVGGAEPGAFDTLIIDEVSKLTVPEFLAIAVKARRWVLVGDPQQLPPHCDSTECAWTLRDVLDPALELVCSVAAVLERLPPAKRPSTRLVVVTSWHPDDMAAAIEAHLLDAKDFGHAPKVLTLDEVWSNDSSSGILVCKASEVQDAANYFDGDARVLAELGLESRIDIHDDRLVAQADRAGARIFKTMFDVYHAQPWEKLARQKLPAVCHRKWIDRYLPSQAAIDSLRLDQLRKDVLDGIATRYLVNAVSVYDLLLGLPDAAHFDVSPMAELSGRGPRNLCERVRPFTGVLKKQYRMHSSLSRLPRELFYGGTALHDGRADDSDEAGVRVIQVDRPNDAPHESNPAEVEMITGMLNTLAATPGGGEHVSIMVLTAYKEQKRLLDREVESMDLAGQPITLETCTLDSCQGKEADFVLLSLVRDRASNFLDNPKRWNVALTRAKKGLFIVGDINAYLDDASRRLQEAGRRGQPPLMSLLSRVLMDLNAPDGANR